MAKKTLINNIVVISDTHIGSSLALCPKQFQLDDGNWASRSPLQKKIWDYWVDFWKWAYRTMKGEKFVLVHNGDIVDGVHHGTTTLLSHSMVDQENMAVEILKKHVDRAEAYYQIRGTEVHVGQSGCHEERVAARLGAVTDPDNDRHSRWELWMEFGKELIHFSHHIGATNSTAYESSAPMREIVAAFVEAGQWGHRPPTIVIRSHRHRYIEVKPPNCRIIVTPAWQGKTPFVHKIDRLRMPMFGGLIIRRGEEGVHIREKIYEVKRDEPVKL